MDCRALATRGSAGARMRPRRRALGPDRQCLVLYLPPLQTKPFLSSPILSSPILVLVFSNLRSLSCSNHSLSLYIVLHAVPAYNRSSLFFPSNSQQIRFNPLNCRLNDSALTTNDSLIATSPSSHSTFQEKTKDLQSHEGRRTASYSHHAAFTGT